MIWKESYKRMIDQLALENAREKFGKLAAYVVDSQVTDANGFALEKDHREVLINDFSYDMMIGSLSTRKKYMLLGGLIGVGFMTVSILTYKFIKFEKNKES